MTVTSGFSMCANVDLFFRGW